MAAVDPFPVTGEPDITWRRGGAYDFDARFRRRHHDDPAVVMTLIGGHDATGGAQDDDEGEGQCGVQPLALIHDDNHTIAPICEKRLQLRSVDGA